MVQINFFETKSRLAYDPKNPVHEQKPQPQNGGGICPTMDDQDPAKLKSYMYQYAMDIAPTDQATLTQTAKSNYRKSIMIKEAAA